VLVPLRLFLGVTFVYAGLQKLTDPQFFRPSAPRYIGHQITAFAHGSPISGLLLHVALPHAIFVGGLIAFGEIAIGIGTLIGMLARPAACFGLLLSLVFFLSASWKVYPYFYGADIVFCFAWISLGLAPHAGLPSLDAALAQWAAERWGFRPGRWRAALELSLSAPLSAAGEADAGPRASVASAGRMTGTRRHPGRYAGRAASQRQESRRNFLLGLASGAIGVLGLTWLWGAIHRETSDGTPPGSSPDGGGTGTSPGTGTSSAPSSVIARTSDVPVNGATTFTLASTGDPGVLVHLADGRFVAYDATCTHAGCPVQYDAGSKDLYCPCHGAVFDPASQAAVLDGPAPSPLTPVPITVQSNGDIVLAG
jgi:thiosulfate dehydrogenase [quinone] large subunit